ncbi:MULTISPECIES: hypothetical protein [unclassified Streptomyces]|uniref:hypothetical protein n=1 Tax=unclassified Streptomyces TaxID=2593676 RepID=UPI00210C0CB5|nr:hypothetical protein [Streptomyces sp. ScaeMP-e83]
MAFVIAMHPLATTAKKKLLLPLMPLAGGIFLFLDTAGDEGAYPVVWFTVIMLSFVVLRIIFAPYLRRQLALVHAGEQMQPLTGRQNAVFLCTLLVVMVALFVLI